MINITPGKVFAAGHEIKLVTEVAVMVVEVAVQDQCSQREEQNDTHAIGKE